MYIDSLITLYHTQYPFYITPSDDKDTTIVHEPAPTMPPHKKPNLLIDTSKGGALLSHSRHYPHSAFTTDVPQLLFSPTSSISSFGSSSTSYHWSPDDDNYSRKRSQVEDMIHLFENGHRYMEQHRRHSVDSHWNTGSRKRIYIRERRYEYQPTVGQWKRRIDGEFPMQLSESKSTPIQPSRQKMAPIMETSTSLWA
ncbi:hypothetical protein FB192DRAFT_1401212 [Mucor lusitanicus]|uniref:Uncharacterized protein n=1 Tax=Mucor circinelloides f. lusitanicus TaxID=29924 RepID=A0A8H4B9P7_MUCCL|nr:hypothetical protein FB192DRAFT_1401212 [Mucor lusitanicus]